MRNRAWYLFTALLWISLCANATAEESKETSSFTQAVVEKAINFMPEDIKAKLLPIKKDILTSAKPDSQIEKAHQGLIYYVSKKEGDGPETFAETFRQVRKAVAGKSSYSTLAPKLGKLTKCIIALSQPYHTDEAAFKLTAHSDYEKKLDSAAGSLKADFDGSQKVDNPSDFATKLAESANELLKKLNTTNPPEESVRTEVQTSVFSLATNRLADCWWTLLNQQSPDAKDAKVESASIEEEAANFIGNRRSLKFHLPTCRYLPAEKNQVPFKTREEAIIEGFIPCKVCQP